MWVRPGKSGQPFDGDYNIEKVRDAKNRAPEVVIEVDGGITPELIPIL